MLLGTDTEGREITYDDATCHFSIGGITTGPDRILAYDRGGQVSWASDDARAWVARTDAEWRRAAEEARATRAAAARHDDAAGAGARSGAVMRVQNYEPDKIVRLAGTLKGLAIAIMTFFTCVGAIAGLGLGAIGAATGTFRVGLVVFPLVLGGISFGIGYLVTLALKVAADLLVSVVQIEVNTRGQ
jgi:hypothetical protein